jgi:predicted nucleic acid-binding protein
MVLVDTSVLINYIRNIENSKTFAFETIIAQGIPFGISIYTYQEVLQGARDEKEFSKLKKYLLEQNMFFLPDSLDTYEAVARIYFNARRNGITPRNSIDVFIAQTCIYYDLSLLHDDRDFDAIAAIASQLKVYKTGNI